VTTTALRTGAVSKPLWPPMLRGSGD